MADPQAFDPYATVVTDWNAPPPEVVPVQGQPAPAPTPAGPPPINPSQRQLWGTEGVPGQAAPAYDDRGQPIRTPYAFDVGPPPVPKADLKAPPNPQLAVDDAHEWHRNREDEINAFAKGPPLSITDYQPLKEQFTREQHPDWDRLQQAQEVLNRMQANDPKQYKLFKPQVDQLSKRVDGDVKARERQLSQTRREQLSRDDAPFQLPEARDKTASAMNTHVAEAVTESIADVGSKDPATARQADYTLSVSPIMTMSKPKPGTDPNAKPDPTNRDYSPLRNAATDIVMHNRNLPNEVAVRAAIQMGTPGGGTDENGKPVPGHNGRTGMGATNYKVLGRDDLGNVMVETRDGVRLRVPGQTFRQFMVARQQGAQRARKWEEDYKASQEPGLVRKAINWGLSVIPEKGF